MLAYQFTSTKHRTMCLVLFSQISDSSPAGRHHGIPFLVENTFTPSIDFVKQVPHQLITGDIGQPGAGLYIQSLLGLSD